MACPFKRNTHHHGDLKAELISATKALVEKNGADAVSINQAARQAGVSTAAPYKHFKDRDALLTAVAHDCLMEMQTKTAAILSEHPKGDLEGILAICRNYIRFATENANVFKLMFSLTRAHAKDDEMMENSPEGFRMVRQAVGAYLGCGEEDKLAVDRSFMIWSFVHGLSFIIIDEKSEAVGVFLDLDSVLTNGIKSLLVGADTPVA
ncbi:MAG: TetR/AcrR family transcriptional regulator [Pseudomonadota bacterium]